MRLASAATAAASRACQRQSFTALSGSRAVTTASLVKDYIRQISTSAGDETRLRSNAEYCVSLVKRCDYENYLCLLLLPSAVRHPAFTVRAANVEFAAIMDSAAGQKAAAGRFVFWRECVDRAHRRVPVAGHPVAEELALAMARYGLSKIWLNKLISARERLLGEAHMHSVQDLENYAEDTCSSVNYLLLEAAGLRSLAADHAASHLGKCQGIVNLLRGVKQMAAKNLTYLPQDLLTKHGLSQEDALRGRNADAVKEVVYELASLASGHLQKYGSMSEKLPPAAKAVCLPHVICAAALENFRRLDFNASDRRWNAKMTMLPWKLWRAS